MRSTCWSRSGWTSPSCATRTGTTSFIIAAIRPCRSGRFMLDVHGESTSTWAASDALCAGPADQQPSAGLRQGLQEPQPRLSAARRAGRQRCDRRDAGRGEVAASAAALPAGARGANPGAARRKQVAQRRGQGFPARARDCRDPGLCRQDRRHAEGARSAQASACI